MNFVFVETMDDVLKAALKKKLSPRQRKLPPVARKVEKRMPATISSSIH